MTRLSKTKRIVYILDESHMQKLDELISEIQCVYCEIFSNRGLSVTSGISHTPAAGFLNAISENGLSIDDILEK